MPVSVLASLIPACRKRFSVSRVVRWSLVCIFVLWALCQIPLISTEQGWQPLWRHRANTIATYTTWQQVAAQHERTADAGLKTNDLVLDSENKWWRLTGDEKAGKVQALAAVGGGIQVFEASELRIPELPESMFALIPHSSHRNYEGVRFAPPGTPNAITDSTYLMGSDGTGRDVLVRILFGTRIALTVGLVATGLAMGIGIIIGAISGFFGGWVDVLLQRMVEIMMAFPTLLLILIIVAMLDRNIFYIMTVIGLTGWAGTARLVRGEFLGQAGREYVLAAQALGLPRWRIMFRHMLPNTLTPLFISATFSIAGAILTESSLAFIGLGDDGVPSWGAMLADGRRNPQIWWMIYTPGIAIFLLVSSLNLVGNALRDALDPRRAQR